MKAVAKTYAGDRTIDGIQVSVDGRPLDPRYDLRRFTDNGFEWSYEGPEPEQLAFALLVIALAAGGIAAMLAGGDSLTTGILGGYTTFSSFSLQTLSLARDGEWLIGFGPVSGDDTLSTSGDLKQAAARLFDPFFTTKLGKGGSGLGLHICHNIVYGPLRGRLRVHSVPGQGTTQQPEQAAQHAVDRAVIALGGFRQANLQIACAEPLSIGLHAVHRAGELAGRTVLVTGGGTIGCMSVIAARLAGAAEVIVCDIADRPLAIATQVGADRTIRSDQMDAASLADIADITIEAAGSPAALASLCELIV